MGSLSGKVAIVTGASNGIGRAIAERLAEDGAIVVVNYNHSYEKAKHVVTGIQAKGGKAVTVQSDMSQVTEARRLVIETVDDSADSTFSSTMPGGLCLDHSWRQPRLTSIRSSP
jgi:NAD(P)-dependent dehydrogenase (short-subunit alcohol dehydrogenase family)